MSPSDNPTASPGETTPIYYDAANPDVGALLREFERCSPVVNGWHRLLHNERTRYARWSPQWPDNKKYDSKEAGEALPWNGCSDVRVFLVDDAVNELVSVLVVAFWRAAEQVTSMNPAAQDKAARVKKLFQWLIGTKQRRELIREVELSAQYLLTYGQAVLHPFWERVATMDLDEVTLEQLQGLAQQAPDSPLAALPGLIMDPAMEEEAVEAVRALGTELVQRGFQQAMDGHELAEALADFRLSTKRARRLVRDLRETGRGQVPLPKFTKNGPSIVAKKPFEEIFMRAGATDLQGGPVFDRQFLTEVELRHMAVVNGWDEAWVDEAVKNKGRFTIWTEPTRLSFDPDQNWAFDSQTTDSDRIEVIWAVYWQLAEEEDVKQIVYTVFHANITDKWAKHGPLNLPHKQMPYVLGLLERPDRRVDWSRSLPERLASRQREVKVQRDALIDKTSIGVLPPVNIYDTGMDTDYVFGPAARNMISPGREPQFMAVPGGDEKAAFALIERVDYEVSNAVGLMSEKVPPARSQAKLQMLVNTFLLMWSEAFAQEFALIQEYLPAEEYQRITGDQQPLDRGDVIAKEYDLVLSFDARNLDMEHVMAQFEAITKGVLPVDRESVVSTGRLVKAMMRAINPTLAEEVVVEQEMGAEAVKRKVQNDLLLMFTGNTPEYGQDDNPAAGMQSQLLQQMIQANPKYMAALGKDPDFTERVQEYEKNLQFSQQQQANKQVGRTGVK